MVINALHTPFAAVNPVATLNGRIGPTALARGRRSTNESGSSLNWHACTIHDYLPRLKPRRRPRSSASRSVFGPFSNGGSRKRRYVVVLLEIISFIKQPGLLFSLYATHVSFAIISL